MVTVRITELYDLNTVRNKMGLIAVHTPGFKQIARLYPGFLMNYGYMKALSCDIAVACASMLPADPLQVGTDTGEIAPQDLFNPILYKACTNDSFNTVVNRIYGMSDPVEGTSLATPGAVGNDPWSGSTYSNTTDIYYALLSEDGWRKAMPQSGFSMKGLRPLVYPVLSTYGNTRIPDPGGGLSNVGVTTSAGVTNVAQVGIQFRGRPQAMPSVPTTVFRNTQTIGESSSHPFDVFTMDNPGIPKTFVACICTPPSKLHVLYYRLRITWTLEFFDPITMNEKATLGTLNNNGVHLHENLTYVPSSKDDVGEYLPPVDLPTQDDLVDTQDACITKILEK